MKAIWILLFCFTISIDTYAQDITQKVKLHKTKVRLLNGERIKGSLYSITDTALVLVNLRSKSEVFNFNQEMSSIPIKHIERINMWRKGKAGKSTLIGLGSGIAIGVVVGLSEDLDMTDHTGSVILFGTFFGTCGTLIGSIVGSIPNVSLVIHGDLKKYQSYKDKLEKYASVK